MRRTITVCFAALVFVVAGISQPAQAPEIVAATKLLQEKKYGEAETALANFIKDNPENARALYLLASARHGKADYKGAVEALKKNLAINQNWPAMYNLASAYARLGDKESAFEWLEKSLTNGGAFAVNIETDEDLAGLRGEPAFKTMQSIIDKQRNPCKYSEKAQEFDFWLGDWDVFVGGRKVGENLIERGVNGCTLIENWKNTGGGTGKSLNVYDASVGKWKQFYVGSQGGVFLFEGGREGNMMKFTAETVNQTGAKTLHRFEFTDNPDKTVRQKWDTSTDGGKTYTTVWDSIYKKKSGVGSQDSGREINRKPLEEVSNQVIGLAGKKEVSFESTDGVKLFADVYPAAAGKNAPLVLLFHQGGGDVRGEYATHIPKLLAKGYNVIAIDLRTGGDRFGSENRTVAALGDKKFGYCDAYPDLEASLKYARGQGFTGKTVVWGSSFSAALVFQLGAKHGDALAGALAFSPASGGPMAACKPDLYMDDINIPVFAARPRTEMNENTQAQFAAFEKKGIVTYIAENGVHGSSMLNPERVEGDVVRHWEAVFAFLESALGS